MSPRLSSVPHFDDNAAMPRIVPPTPDAIAEAAALLKSGQLIGMPTETVYGLAGVATDPDAVARIFAAKQRPTFNPLITHVASPDWIHEFVVDIPELANQLIQQFWPGPLTIILPKRDIIPELVTAGLPTVALRCPAHPIAQQLIEAVGQPLAAPSANRYMHVSPTTAAHVAELGDAVPLIIDGGPCEAGLESTVIGFAETGQPILFRKGALALEAITESVGKLLTLDTYNSSAARPAPGMVKRHYAPNTPLILHADTDLNRCDPATTALLLFQKTDQPKFTNDWPHVFTLSPTGDTRDAAKNLFATLRKIDTLNLNQIIVWPAPPTELGPAINDRLQRAATAL